MPVVNEPSPYTIQLGSWRFAEIKPEDLDMYADFIAATEYPANLWSSNFAYLWASSQSRMRKVLWKIVDDMLVTFGHSYKNSLYLFCLPFGKGNPDQVTQVVLKCLQYCDDWNHHESRRTAIRMINQSQLEFLQNGSGFAGRFRLVTLRGIERHLDIKKLVSLAGKDFANIRNRVNKFRREHPDVVIRRYQGSDYDGLIDLRKAWSRGAGQKYPVIFDKGYYRAIIVKYAALNQIILVFEADAPRGREIIGMVSGSALPTGQAWGSLMKYREGIPGLSETLTVEFARELYNLNPLLELINVGSDLGPGGLRDYKLKFRPALNLKRYQVYLR